MDLIADLETEKRACLIRLRHMEAYCHGPTPPPTPRPNGTSATSAEEQRPSRKVTDRDFHNLATQYRERDAMNNLHRSKIEVLRGRQEKIYQGFVTRKEREAAEMEQQDREKYEAFCKKCDGEEELLEKALEEKKTRLQQRWKLQEQVERSKVEKLTGTPPEPLPELSIPPLVT